MNDIHNEAVWPIKTKSLVENLNIYEMQKQTCEHVNLKYRESQCWKIQKRRKNKYYEYMNDFGLDYSDIFLKNLKLSSC